MRRSLVLLAFLLAACTRKESLDPNTMPDAVRPDYVVFARKCSKCHTLARPLNANITDDDQWVHYVARMKHQPGSGISETDEATILRFLRWYAADLRRQEAEKNHASLTTNDGGAVKHLVIAIVLVLLGVLALASPAEAIERNFAGSAQLDYNFAPTAHEAKATPGAFDGFTMELAAKVAVDFSDHVSANLKVCYGCHGFEADMMYFDLRAADALNVRIGRFSPSFGAFNLRHDPANHRLSDKPLPYDMGRMLRMRTWNLGVLPSPFPDNGIEVNGTKWFGTSVQFDYAAYGVTGFKGDPNPTDIDFVLSRSPSSYYTDNNARPTFGGRMALTFKLSETKDLTAGASGMYGTYDNDNQDSYLIFGGDLTLRLDKTTFRAEYLARRTEFSIADRTVFKYVVADTQGDYFMKHGAYVEAEQAITPDVDVIGRIDGLARIGNVAAGSDLSRRSGVVRATVGTAYALERGIRIKLSTEFWDFTDRDSTNSRKTEISAHAALAGSF